MLKLNHFFGLYMLSLSVQSPTKSIHAPAILIPIELLSSLAEQWPVLKKIKQKDMPENSSWRSWDLLDQNSLFIIYQLDLTKSYDQQQLKNLIVHINTHKINSAMIYFGDRPAEQARLLGRLVTDALFSFDEFLSKKKVQHLKELTVLTKDKQVKTYLEQGSLIGHAMHYTRTLAEMPSNVCTPTYLAKKAAELAKKHKKISISVLNEKEIKELNMNSFLSVAKGSTQPPKFITLHYKGSKKAPYVFVGKGITFDTGGHSLKPAASMMGMKFDMSGAATVLGLFHFLAAYQPELSVIGLIPCCENIPGTDANKPDDIIYSMSGKSIEILNTDAEGRLILCDALTYAERFEPNVVIDVATLTGACLATFASVATGLMSNDEELSRKLLKAAHDSTDKAWSLPLWDEYHELINSPVADMANIGGPYAGSITAGCFLSKFATQYKWAHLDIAGTACIFQGHKRGSTGRPIPLLVEFLLNELS